MNEYMQKIKKNIFSSEGKKEVIITIVSFFIAYLSLYILIKLHIWSNYPINILLALLMGITTWIILHLKFKVPFI